jgi:hypothetical protein
VNPLRVGLSLAASTLAALVTAAPAAAAFPANKPEAGPVLAGSSAIWAEDRGDGGFNVRSAHPGERPALLLTFPPSSGTFLTPELAASPSRLVVAAGITDAGTPWSRRAVYTAAIGRPAETLDPSCDIYGAADLPRNVDVSGNSVLYPRCTTSQGGEAVQVRDYSGATPTTQTLEDAIPAGLRIAGRYVAWLDPGGGQVANPAGIVVYDRIAHATLYRLTRAAVGGDVHNLDLQANGMVAFSYEGRGGERVAWASPADARRHTLSLPAHDSYEVRIANNEIAFEAGSEVNGGVIALARIGISDLSGHARAMGNLGEGSFFTDDFDFDGRRIAWWSYGCTHALIHVIDASGSPHLSGPRSGCRLRFTRPPRLEDHGARLHLFINCFGFDGTGPAQCSARRTVITTKLNHTRVLVGDKRRGVRVKLTATGKELLKKLGDLRVRVVTTLIDAAGRKERRAGHARVELR